MADFFLVVLSIPVSERELRNTDANRVDKRVSFRVPTIREAVAGEAHRRRVARVAPVVLFLLLPEGG